MCCLEIKPPDKLHFPSGQDLAGGVYYYRAEVTFDRLYPHDRVKEIHGWVHIVR